LGSNSSIGPALNSLSRALDSTIAAIRTALPAEPAAVPATAFNGDPQALLAPLTHLKNLLAADDGDADDFLLELRPTLAAVLTPAELNSLSTHVGNFAYSDALQLLASIASRLSLTLE
jgi:hypothetical protein